MKFEHTPVLLNETIESLDIKQDGTYVDGTLGGAGHASEVCSRLSSAGIFIGIDRDIEALESSKQRLASYECKKIFVHSNYADIKNVLEELNIKGIDGAMLDIGVSSYQLDNSSRGFSYMNDAPLDMRMNRDDTFTAFDVINTYSQDELFKIFKSYGEEKWSSRVAQFIIEQRKMGEINTTYELVDIIKAAIPASARRDGPHPAKRIFQAIRIEVNGELDSLEEGVEDYIDVLNPEGRLCVITFHSLEDRIVKEIFNKRVNPCICPPEMPICVCEKVADIAKITKKPITATQEELDENPRSRSAKLRVCKRVGS